MAKKVGRVRRIGRTVKKYRGVVAGSLIGEAVGFTYLGFGGIPIGGLIGGMMGGMGMMSNSNGNNKKKRR